MFAQNADTFKEGECWEMKGLLEEEHKYGYYLGMFVDHQIKI